MTRSLFLAALTLSLAIISCSGTSNLTQEGRTSSNYPVWYAQQTVVESDSVIHAYASAIDDDSAAAVTKAVAWAESELQASLSHTFENIRTEAASQQNETDLEDPNFIRALRKAENAVSEITSLQNKEVRTAEGFESVRSFAEVTVRKEELIEKIGEQLADYENAWNAMKASQAFKSF